MITFRKIAPLAAMSVAVLIAACASGDEAMMDSGAVEMDEASSSISLSEMAGTWNVRAVPEAGTDTAATMFVLTATSDTAGWTLTYPNAEPQPARVTTSGDSIMIEVGPGPSTRRTGAMVTTSSVSRMEGDSLVGVTVARYSTGADSVVRFRTVAKRAP